MRSFRALILNLALALLAAPLLGACTEIFPMGQRGGDGAREARNAPSVTVNVSPVATNAYGASQGSGSATEAWGDSTEGGRAGTAGAATGNPSAAVELPR